MGEREREKERKRERERERETYQLPSGRIEILSWQLFWRLGWEDWQSQQMLLTLSPDEGREGMIKVSKQIKESILHTHRFWYSPFSKIFGHCDETQRWFIPPNRMNRSECVQKSEILTQSWWITSHLTKPLHCSPWSTNFTNSEPAVDSKPLGPSYSSLACTLLEFGNLRDERLITKLNSASLSTKTLRIEP